MPTRISTWLLLIAICSAICALIRWAPLMLVPLTIVGVLVGPYFLRRLSRNFVDLFCSIGVSWSPVISTGLTVIAYAAIVPLVRTFFHHDIRLDELPLLVLLSTGAATYSGFIACLTMRNCEKTWKRLSQHPMIWQACLQGILFVVTLLYVWHTRSLGAFILSWFALAFSLPFVDIARIELADRKRYGDLAGESYDFAGKEESKPLR